MDFKRGQCVCVRVCDIRLTHSNRLFASLAANRRVDLFSRTTSFHTTFFLSVNGPFSVYCKKKFKGEKKRNEIDE